MDFVATYIDLALAKADLFAEIASTGFSMTPQQERGAAIVAAQKENYRQKFAPLAQSGRAIYLDVEDRATLGQVHLFRTQTFIEYGALISADAIEARNKTARPNPFKEMKNIPRIIENCRLRQVGLTALAEHERFMRALRAGSPKLAEKLQARAEEELAKPARMDMTEAERIDFSKRVRQETGWPLDKEALEQIERVAKFTVYIEGRAIEASKRLGFIMNRIEPESPGSTHG